MTINRTKRAGDRNGDESHRRSTDHWHIGKEIPIAFVGAVLLQTVALVFWIAQLSSEVKFASAQMIEFKNERYTREDSRRDRDLDEQKRQTQKLLDEGIQRSLNAIEARMERLERK